MQTQIQNETQLAEWVREQFQKANKHLAEKGVLFDSVVTEESRYLAPFVAIWKLKDRQGKYYWVISGDVPTDFILAENAKDARGALKHFSLHWQLTAENIQTTNGLAEQDKAFASVLVKAAENLYQMVEDDAIWQTA